MSKSYLDRKEAWAKKMAGSPDSSSKERSGDRLPPGQHTVEKLPVLDLGIQPRIEEEDWALEIGGEVENELRIDWKSLMKFNYVEEMSDFHCVTTWSKYDCKWGGFKMSEVLDELRPHSDAEHVLFVSYDLTEGIYYGFVYYEEGDSDYLQASEFYSYGNSTVFDIVNVDNAVIDEDEYFVSIRNVLGENIIEII